MKQPKIVTQEEGEQIGRDNLTKICMETKVMGDAGNDNYEREVNRNNALKLMKGNAHHFVKKIKELRPVYMEYRRLRKDLIEMGFFIKEDGDSIKVWEEIGVDRENFCVCGQVKHVGFNQCKDCLDNKENE